LRKKQDKNKVNYIITLINSLNNVEKKRILQKLSEKEIPISAFKANLSTLEIIVKYLREEKKHSIKDISKILNRKLSTIYNTYNNSLIKFKGSLDLSDISITIPYTIFSDRKFSNLELVVSYLKERFSLKFSQISYFLNRDQSTIRTVFRRFTKKNE
jgi:predicted DNA-binding ArsR family transcriptional regulator